LPLCWLIMCLAERLCSKFHICPRSFASRPNIHFSDNLSAADIISRHTSHPKGFVFLISIWGFCDIQNNQGQGRGYQPQPSLNEKNGSHVFASFTDGKQHKAHELDMITVTLTWLPVTLTWLLYNLQIWCHRCWLRKFTVCFRPIKKEIVSSMYNNGDNSFSFPEGCHQQFIFPKRRHPSSLRHRFLDWVGLPWPCRLFSTEYPEL